MIWMQFFLISLQTTENSTMSTHGTKKPATSCRTKRPNVPLSPSCRARAWRQCGSRCLKNPILKYNSHGRLSDGTAKAPKWLMCTALSLDLGVLVVPEVSSERKRYVPIGFLKSDVIASNKLYIIQNADLYLFGILTSNVHNAWMRVVAGRLKSDYSYSPLSRRLRRFWMHEAFFHRQALPTSTMMPPELRKTHRENDKAVIAAYGFKASMTESEVVAELFKLYENLTKAQ